MLQQDWQKPIGHVLPTTDNVNYYSGTLTSAQPYQPTIVTSGTTAQNFSASTLMNR